MSMEDALVAKVFEVGDRKWRGIGAIPESGYQLREEFAAFDAENLSRALWTSDVQPGRDALGYFAKFNPPTVANGKVYVATFQQERIDNGAHKKMDGGDQPALVIYGPK